MVKSMLIVYVFTYSLPGVTLNNKQQSNRWQWVCRRKKMVYILVSFMTLFSCFWTGGASFYFALGLLSSWPQRTVSTCLKASRFLRQPFLIGVHPHVSWVTLRSGNSGVFGKMRLMIPPPALKHLDPSHLFLHSLSLPLAGLDYFPCVLGVLSGLHYIISPHACLPSLDHWIALGWWTCVIILSHPGPEHGYLVDGSQLPTSLITTCSPNTLLLTHLHASPAHI